MKRSIPLIPTLLVLAAVAVMLRLGFWQLDRLRQKEALLARYATAMQDQAEVVWPATGAENLLYHRARLVCARVTGASSVSGSNARGQAGIARVVDCVTNSGAPARVVLGWARAPVTPDWRGGEVHGMIAPGPRLVADPPLAGLAANARPDPSTIPNNHLAYAVQWLLFAITALVIYGVALWQRAKAR